MKIESHKLWKFYCRFSQTRQILQMEEDVDLEMLQQRENDIKQLEVSITM